MLLYPCSPLLNTEQTVQGKVSSSLDCDSKHLTQTWLLCRRSTELLQVITHAVSHFVKRVKYKNKHQAADEASLSPVDNAILLTLCVIRETYGSVFSNVIRSLPCQSKSQLSLPWIWLASFRPTGATRTPIRRQDRCLLVPWLASCHLEPPPSPRTHRRKMSNPQPGLLNHGNIHGTTGFSSESKSCLNSWIVVKTVDSWADRGGHGVLCTCLFEAVNLCHH